MNPRFLFNLLFLLAWLPGACAAPATNGEDEVVQLIQQDILLRLTEQAINHQRVETSARLTATQQGLDATATQQQRGAEAQTTALAATATHNVWLVTVQAAQAQDTATAQAHAQAATATLAAAATTTSLAQTAQAPAIAAQQTAVFAQARKTEIELQKSAATIWVSAWGGWFFALVVLAAALYVIWKRSQLGVITDENGKVRLILLNQRALQPDLMFDPVIDFSNRQVCAPQLGISRELQRQVVHESKVVEAIGRLPPGYARPALGLATGLGQTHQPPTPTNIRLVPPAENGIVALWDADIQNQMAQEVQDD